MPCFWVFRRAKTQSVHHCDRTCAHGENVAHDAADTGRGALKRLNERWVVVALHLEHHRIPFADINHAGVFARPLNHSGSCDRQPAQMRPRGFVRAVFAPHYGEDSQFYEIGIAAKQFLDPAIFIRGKTVRADQISGDGCHESASSRLWNIARPEVEPSSGSQARSGCGINPSTLRF